MGKKHQNEKPFVRALGHERLNEYYRNGVGRKRHEDKRIPGEMDDKLYARKTVSDYHESWNYYCDEMRNADFRVDGHRPRNLEEAALFMPAYIDILKNKPGRWNRNMSAYTIRSYFAAPAKIFGLHAEDYDLPRRLREDIMRSRGREKNANFSEENNEEIITFCRCTGLRADKELARVRGMDLVEDDGEYYVHVICGKGGRERLSRIWGPPEEVEAVVKRMREAGEELVWPEIPSHLDVHALRAEYAYRMYKDIARDPAALPPEKRYCCRKDMKGIWLDKDAMQTVSFAMGHTRISVIAEHYLWGLKYEKEILGNVA